MTGERGFEATHSDDTAPAGLQVGALSEIDVQRASRRSQAGQAADIRSAMAAVQRAGGARAGGEDTGQVHEAAARGVSGSGGALPHLDAIQRSFGSHDVSGVQAHVGGEAAAASAAMGAQAYATGNDVAFGRSPDLHTAAHEAAHVVQQRGGVSLKGGVGQVGDPYERHADAVADRVVQGKSAVDLLDQMAGGGGTGAAVMRKAVGGPSPEQAPPTHEHGPDTAPDDQQVGQGGSPGDPKTKAAAIARHSRNRERMRSIIEAGLAQEIDPALGADSRKNLWRNSAQWADSARCTVYVLSPIHDANARPGIGAGDAGYFDTRKDYQTAGATYANNVNDNTGIEIGSTRLLGSLSSDGATLTVIDPLKQSESLLVETLIHEVQHDADQHQAGAAFEAKPPGGSTAPAWAYNSYQTEFRAYWLENPPGSQADAWPSASDPVQNQITLTVNEPGPDAAFGTADDVLVGTVTTTLKNARQEAILRQLVEPLRANGDWWANGDWTQSYAYVGYYMGSDPKFLQMINDLDAPVSGNALNSLRIQALSDAVAAQDLGQITTACSDLDGADRAFLADKNQSKPLWDQVARDLDGLSYIPHRLMITTSVTGGAAPAPIADGGTYTVVAGDTLTRIAERALGDGTRYPEIVALNPVKLANPNRIAAGWELRLPKP